MFELYFGAFDILLYAIAFITAVMIAGGICDVMDTDGPLTASSATLSTVSTSGLTYMACAPSPQGTAATTIKRLASERDFSVSAQPSSIEQSKPVLRVADVRLYKLHKQSVIPVSALSFSIPDTIKRYILRGQPVVRLDSLQEIATVIV